MMVSWIKNQLFFAFIFAILILLYPGHALSLVGSIVAFLLGVVIYFAFKLNVPFVSYFIFHFISVTLMLVYPVKQMCFVALLCFFLRENLFLVKTLPQKGSRTSLLWDLGAIKPERPLFPVCLQVLPFVCVAFLSSLFVFSFSYTVLLDYFPLFIFARALRNLLKQEGLFAANQNGAVS
jgi:hypothetical protein